VLQEAEEPQVLRTIGIDPAAFISEVHMEKTLKQLPVVICMAIAAANEAKRHAYIENDMHMPGCSCGLCFCLS